MADTPEEIEQEIETPEHDDQGPVDKETVKSWVKEALEDVLGQIPGEGTVKPEAENSELPTLRQMERIARETVEAAMEPLRAQVEAKPKPKPKPKPEAEPKAEPAATEVKDKLRAFLWGES